MERYQDASFSLKTCTDYGNICTLGTLLMLPYSDSMFRETNFSEKNMVQIHTALQQGVNLIPRDDNSTVNTDNFTLQVRKEREKCKNAPNILHGIPPLKIYEVICKKYNLFSKKKCRTKAHRTERQLNSKPSVCTMMHDAMVGKCHSDNLYEQSLLCSVCLRFYFSSYNLI